MALLILIVLILIVTIFLANAGILLWIKKLFKIENPTYKKSLIILVFYAITYIVFSIILKVTSIGFISNIFVTVLFFFIFHYLLKRYYFNTWRKSLGIYVVFVTVSFFLAFVIVTPIRSFVIEPYLVAGNSMSPMYSNNDYLVINKFDKNFSRGDVVVFRYPEDQTKFFIERIVGLPTEKVEIKSGKVLINDQILDEGYSRGQTLPDNSVTLAQDQYFVLGDDRGGSLDSRNFGPIIKSSIQGKIFYNISGLFK